MVPKATLARGAAARSTAGQAYYCPRHGSHSLRFVRGPLPLLIICPLVYDSVLILVLYRRRRALGRPVTRALLSSLSSWRAVCITSCIFDGYRDVISKLV